VTATPSSPGTTSHPTTGRHGITARIRTVGGRLSDRIHAAADDRARARDWQVTQTPARLVLNGRSYRDPRFAARRQGRHDTPARTDERHE
jgi:hypothetical protein